MSKKHRTQNNIRIRLAKIPLAMLLILFVFTVPKISYLEIISQATSTNPELFRELLAAFGIVLAGIGALGRMWCTLYIAGRKNKVLAVDGPYSLCRNPLYFFSLIGATGITLMTEMVTVVIVMWIIFGIYYHYIIKGEEKVLNELFPNEFPNYVKRINKFWPSFKHFKEPMEYLVSPIIYRKHIGSAIWFIWALAIIEAIEALRCFIPEEFFIKLY